jgi:hypothetical protein
MLPSNAYGRKYPVAIACFTDDLDELLAIHRGPMRHRPLACAQVPRKSDPSAESSQDSTPKT